MNGITFGVQAIVTHRIEWAEDAHHDGLQVIANLADDFTVEVRHSDGPDHG